MAGMTVPKCPLLCRWWWVGSDLALPLVLVPDDPPEAEKMNCVKLNRETHYYQVSYNQELRDQNRWNRSRTWAWGCTRSGPWWLWLLKCRTCWHTTACIGSFIRRLLEETVLEGIVGLNSRLGVVVQHSENEVLELQVVSYCVARFSRPTTAWSTTFHSQDSMELSSCRRFILFTEKQKDILVTITSIPTKAA